MKQTEIVLRDGSLFRYSGRHLSGWPKDVEKFEDGRWQACPNVNRAIEISRKIDEQKTVSS